MVEKIAHKLTRNPRLVALIAVLLLIPSALGYIGTRVNYDILTYLPQDLESPRVSGCWRSPFTWRPPVCSSWRICLPPTPTA